MRDMTTWKAAELRVFLDEMRDHRLYAAFVVAATTGMRRGEVLGMRWRDLEFETRQLAIRQTLVSVNYELSFAEPKTARGRRTIALDAATIQLLARHRDNQVAEQLIVGRRLEHDLVFTKIDGQPIHPDYFSQLFDRTVARIGLPKIRLHDLRHTYATLSLAAGVPAKVISTRLGHSTVAFTQDVYIHAMPDLETDAAEHMGTVILGRREERPRLIPVQVV
jgi:integrase